MKKITILIFLFHNIYPSYTPRIVKRPCHRHYTDEDYRKEIGNKYFRENITDPNNKKRAKSASILKKLSTGNAVHQSQYTRELSQSLIIKSILPAVYHPPKIGYFEILPKK